MDTDPRTDIGAADPVIRIRQLVKRYPLYASAAQRVVHALFPSRPATHAHTALDGVDLEIAAGETVGILGVNGAGKSTLLQIVTGTLRPTAGSVEVHGRLAALLELGAGFNPEWSGRQNAEFYLMVSGVAPEAVPALIDEVEAFADIGEYFDQPMRTYSSGMFLRVAFAAAVASDPDILVVDEALAVGDARFQNKCFRRFLDFQTTGRTVLFVTHSTELVTRFCTRGVVLSSGRVAADTTPGDAVKAYIDLLYGARAEQPGAPPSGGGVVGSAATGRPTAASGSSPFTVLCPVRTDDGLPSRRHYNRHEQRTGNGEGRILDCAVILDGKPAPVELPSASRIGLLYRVQALAPIARPSVGFLLKTVDDHRIYGTATHLQGLLLPPLEPGEQRLVLLELELAISGGDYFVDLGFAELRGNELAVLEWRQSALALRVPPTEGFFGVADLRGRFREIAEP